MVSEAFSSPEFVPLLSLMVFSLCFSIALVTSSKSFRRSHSARAVRSEYRRNWVEMMLKEGDVHLVADTLRNNLTVLAALLGGLVVSFGLVLNVFTSMTTLVSLVHIAFILVMIAFAFFHLLMEVRTMNYIPILFAVDEKVIEKNEKMGKIEYISKLMDNTYDDFSNSINALFYIIALLTFPLSVPVFIFTTLALTYLFVRRDLSPKSRIEIF